MNGTTLFALEGVLAGRHDEDVDIVRDTLEPAGAGLYHALASISKLILATNLDRRLVVHWCRVNGLTAHTSTVTLSERSITSLRANGENVTLYVDADPERTAAALAAGVPTLLYSRPRYARAAYANPRALPQLQRPWAEVVAESRAQRATRVSPLATSSDSS